MGVEDWDTVVSDEDEDEEEALYRMRAGLEEYVDEIIEEYERKKHREELWEAYTDGTEGYLAGSALDNDATNEKLDRLLDDDYRVPDDVFERYLSTTEDAGWDSTPGEQEDAGEQFPELERKYDLWDGRSPDIERPERFRRVAGWSVGDLDVSAEALYAFARDRTFEGVDGIWLSEVMERSSDTVFLLPGMRGVDYVGAWNTKTVLVDGDVGVRGGYKMENGLLCVKGGAGDSFAVRMRGGTAIANRGVGANAGVSMRGGELVVPDPGAVDIEGKGGRVAGLPRDAF